MTDDSQEKPEIMLLPSGLRELPDAVLVAGNPVPADPTTFPPFIRRFFERNLGTAAKLERLEKLPKEPNP